MSIHKFVSLAVILVCATPVLAITINPPGGFFTSAGIVLSDHPELAGTTLYSSDFPYYSIYPDVYSRYHGTITEFGTFRTTVIQESATGTLDFYYQVIPSSGYSSARMYIGPIDTSISLDADYIRASGSAPGNVQIRDTSGFIYVQASSLLLRTDVTTFSGTVGTTTFRYSLEFPGSQAPIPTVIPGFDPPAPGVPEPASVMMLPLAVAGLGLRLSGRR